MLTIPTIHYTQTYHPTPNPQTQITTHVKQFNKLHAKNPNNPILDKIIDKIIQLMAKQAKKQKIPTHKYYEHLTKQGIFHNCHHTTRNI